MKKNLVFWTYLPKFPEIDLFHFRKCFFGLHFFLTQPKLRLYLFFFLSFTGVLTPGYAFKDTSLVRRLNENGVTFDVTVNNINTIAKS